MNYPELTRIVQIKSRLKDMNDDDILLAIQEVEQAVKNYCNVYEVPEGLKFVVCNMAIDLLNYQDEVNSVDSSVPAAAINDVSSIKVGDVSITLGENSSNTPRKSALKSHKANLDDVVLNYREQLNLFRRLW